MSTLFDTVLKHASLNESLIASQASPHLWEAKDTQFAQSCTDLHEFARFDLTDRQEMARFVLDSVWLPVWQTIVQVDRQQGYAASLQG
jgi:hypothetical protein